MLKFEGGLSELDENLSYCKRQIKGGRFLYAFKSADSASTEFNAFIIAHKNDSNRQAIPPAPGTEGQSVTFPDEEQFGKAADAAVKTFSLKNNGWNAVLASILRIKGARVNRTEFLSLKLVL